MTHFQLCKNYLIDLSAMYLHHFVISIHRIKILVLVKSNELLLGTYYPNDAQCNVYGFYQQFLIQTGLFTVKIQLLNEYELGKLDVIWVYPCNWFSWKDVHICTKVEDNIKPQTRFISKKFLNTTKDISIFYPNIYYFHFVKKLYY